VNSEKPRSRSPLLEGITRVTLHRVEWRHEEALRLHWLGQCRDCLLVYWCDARGEETWPRRRADRQFSVAFGGRRDKLGAHATWLGFAPTKP
jgi:hypothetical protein